MDMNFLITALPMDAFQELMFKNDEELKAFHAKWVIVDVEAGYPCRVSLVDAKIGERVLVLPFCHHDVDSPYQSSGPIFVREKAKMAKLGINEVPKILLHRSLSIRAYDANKLMIQAEVLQGGELKAAIGRFFCDSDIEYLQIHNATSGCFNCSVFRI